MKAKAINMKFLDACRKGDIKEIKKLLTSEETKMYVDIHANQDEAFRHACFHANYEVVKYLASSKDLESHADIHVFMDYGMEISCIKGGKGHLDIIRFLMTSPDLKERCDIRAHGSNAFLKACSYGYHDIVSFVINETDCYRMEDIGQLKFHKDSQIDRQDVLSMLVQKSLAEKIMGLGRPGHQKNNSSHTDHPRHSDSLGHHGDDDCLCGHNGKESCSEPVKTDGGCLYTKKSAKRI